MSRISNSKAPGNAGTKAPHSYAHVNNNFLNYPLARDAHIRPPWRPSLPTGKWWLCELPGDDRIQFRLPKEVAPEHKHPPTGFDINVLMLLIGAAQAAKSHQIVFASYAAILKCLQLPISHHYRQQLRASLSYWCELSIKYQCWHKAGRKQPVTRTLPPAIESVTVDRAVHVTLALQWTTLGEVYFSHLRLPLPMNAGAQNLVLALRCSLVGYSDHDLKVLKPRKLRGLRRKVGLHHSSRQRQFNHLLALQGPVATYFSAGGHELVPQLLGNGLIGFQIHATDRPDKNSEPSRSLPRVRLRPQRPEPVAATGPVQVATYIGDRKEMMWQLPNGKLVHQLPKRWQAIHDQIAKIDKSMRVVPSRVQLSCGHGYNSHER